MKNVKDSLTSCTVPLSGSRHRIPSRMRLQKPDADVAICHLKVDINGLKPSILLRFVGKIGQLFIFFC